MSEWNEVSFGSLGRNEDNAQFWKFPKANLAVFLNALGVAAATEMMSAKMSLRG